MAKSIDPALVRHIALLGRLELSDQQVRALGVQLAAILESFDKLNELDTDAVEPMAHALDMQNVMAADEAGKSLPPERALANAPARDGNFFKVPKILGES